MILGEPGVSVQPVSAAFSDDSLVFFAENGKVLLKQSESVLFLPHVSDVRADLPRDFHPFELASHNGTAIFSCAPDAHISIPERESLLWSSYSAFRDMDYAQGSVVTSCIHLWNWYQSHRFCGCCGGLTVPEQEIRAIRCSKCGHQFFPVISPAVIVAITCGSKLLVAQNAAVKTPRPSLIAGYVEVGETLEHAVQREAMEEVGLPLSDIRYLGDQPWGISGSHMFAFHAHSDDRLPIRIQEEELSWARWVDRSCMEKPDSVISIAAALKERFRLGELE